MPDERKTYSALFELAGKVDKSLLSAAKDARNLLKSLDLASGATDRNVQKVLKDLGHITGMSGRLKTAAHEFGNAWSQAAFKAHRAFEPLHRMIGGLGTITGIGTGLAAVGGLFETAEIAKEGWAVHAEREQSRLLLDTVLKNRGLGNQAEAFNEMLLRFTSDEAKIDYNTAFQSAQMMMNTGRFKGLEDVHRVLGQMADIGGSPEQSKLGLMAISKMLSEGRIEGRHLQELGFDLPQVGWYQEIAKIRGEDVGQLRKEMAHKGSTIDADVLLQVLKSVTGPGGRAGADDRPGR